MADVTISSLPLGTPSGGALLPYSQGGQTLAASPSGIIAAGVTPGTILQTVYGQDINLYEFNTPGTAPINQTSTINITLKQSNSKLIFNTVAYVLGYRNTDVPGAGSWLLYNGASLLPPNTQPYIHAYTTSITYITGTLSIIAEHTPGIINPTYRLGVSKPSLNGTGIIQQRTAYWTVQEIAQ